MTNLIPSNNEEVERLRSELNKEKAQNAVRLAQLESDKPDDGLIKAIDALRLKIDSLEDRLEAKMTKDNVEVLDAVQSMRDRFSKVLQAIGEKLMFISKFSVVMNRKKILEGK